MILQCSAFAAIVLIATHFKYYIGHAPLRKGCTAALIVLLFAIRPPSLPPHRSQAGPLSPPCTPPARNTPRTAKRPRHESPGHVEEEHGEKSAKLSASAAGNGAGSGVLHSTGTGTEGRLNGGMGTATAAGGVAGTSKRTDYLVWDDYFMSVAFLSAMRSKDPSTQVGAW